MELLKGKKRLETTFIKKWANVLQKVQGMSFSLQEDYKQLNTRVNNSVEYEHDKKDYWKAPYELSNDGKGDCEDIAIFKFFCVNKNLGDRFIVIGNLFYKPENKRMDHAILVIKEQDTWLVLDNLTNDIITLNEYRLRYDFIPMIYFDEMSVFY